MAGYESFKRSFFTLTSSGKEIIFFLIAFIKTVICLILSWHDQRQFNCLIRALSSAPWSFFQHYLPKWNNVPISNVLYHWGSCQNRWDCSNNNFYKVKHQWEHNLSVTPSEYIVSLRIIKEYFLLYTQWVIWIQKYLLWECYVLFSGNLFQLCKAGILKWKNMVLPLQFAYW